MKVIPHEIAVRLALEDVPDCLEFGICSESAERLANIFINERHPADHAGNKCGLICKREKPVGFRQYLSRLNHHRGIDSGGGSCFFQLSDKVILR